MKVQRALVMKPSSSINNGGRRRIGRRSCGGSPLSTLALVLGVGSLALIGALWGRPVVAAVAPKESAHQSSSGGPDAAPAATAAVLSLERTQRGRSSAAAAAEGVAHSRKGASRELLGGEPRALESNIANAKIQLSPSDMATAAGHHHGKSHGKYYMYTEVPKKGAYKMGFKRGNHKHMIERKESVHKSHVHSYFKWHDKKGKGSHKFEFKHYDKSKKHY